MKYKKKRGHSIIPTVIYYGKREKIIEKTFFMSAGAQKRWKIAVLEVFYNNIYRILKVNCQ